MILTRGFKKIFGKEYIKIKLSVLWLFVILNYIYADILRLMDASALQQILSGALGITPLTLFFGAILMEIPIAMVVLSLIFERKVNRITNIVAGTIKVIAVTGSLFIGVPAMYYIFFAVIEIVFTCLIIITA